MIIRNIIKCKKCGDIIESKFTHDFVTCSCGACSVDGGKSYLKRCGNPMDWEDLSETKHEECSTCRYLAIDEEGYYCKEPGALSIMRWNREPHKKACQRWESLK